MWHSGKKSGCQTGHLVLIPELGRFPREGNGNPVHCSCQDNPMDRGAWRTTAHGVTKTWTQLSMYCVHNAQYIETVSL